MRNVYLTLTWRQAKSLLDILNMMRNFGNAIPGFNKSDAYADIDFMITKLKSEME